MSVGTKRESMQIIVDEIVKFFDAKFFDAKFFDAKVLDAKSFDASPQSADYV